MHHLGNLFPLQRNPRGRIYGTRPQMLITRLHPSSSDARSSTLTPCLITRFRVVVSGSTMDTASFSGRRSGGGQRLWWRRWFGG